MCTVLLPPGVYPVAVQYIVQFCFKIHVCSIILHTRCVSPAVELAGPYFESQHTVLLKCLEIHVYHLHGIIFIALTDVLQRVSNSKNLIHAYANLIQTHAHQRF